MNRTIDLTPLFCLWSIIFIITAASTQDAGWLWWAAAPWLFAFGLAVVVSFLMLVAVLIGLANKKFRSKS